MTATCQVVKENGRFISKAVYTILGLTIEGKKELLGLYLSENEGAHYWLTSASEEANEAKPEIMPAKDIYSPNEYDG